MASIPVFCRGRDRHPGPGRRRRHGNLQRGRHRPPAAAALQAIGPARRDVGEQCGEGAAEGEALARQLHGLSRPRGRVLGRGRLVAPAGEPRGTGAGARPHQHDRDERQPLSAPRCIAAAGARLSERRAVLLTRSHRGDQRSAVASTLSVGSVDRRKDAQRERRPVRDRGRRAAQLQLSRRRGFVAAIELGPEAAQPRSALHGSGRASQAGHRRRAGVARAGASQRTPGAGVPADERRLAGVAGAAARRHARATTGPR